MTLAESDVLTTAKQVLALRDDEARRLNRIAKYVRGDHNSVYVPRGARREYQWLLKRAKVNLMPLVVSATTQALHVDGYRAAKTDENAAPWDIWQANRLDARQHGIHRSAATYGASYCIVMPGKPQPVIRPVSPRRLTAVYEDPVADEWPIFAVEEAVQNSVKSVKRVVYLYDETAKYTLNADSDSRETLRLVKTELHGLPVCPVIRFVNCSDLDGEVNVAGEVEPLIDLQDQLNVTTFNLYMAQQYSAFRQRWATGMAPPIDANGNPMEPFNIAVDRLIVGESKDTKFGDFQQTDLKGYLDSREATIRYISTVSQIPPHYLLGQLVNISAEALAAAESGLLRKLRERKSTFGEAWEQTLRLAALAAGDRVSWDDTSSQVVWGDSEARSLAQTVDALGKMAQMLAIPKTELWERIPGVSQQDVERWKIAAQTDSALGAINAMIEENMNRLQPPTGQSRLVPQGASYIPSSRSANDATPPPGTPPSANEPTGKVGSASAGGSSGKSAPAAPAKK